MFVLPRLDLTVIDLQGAVAYHLDPYGATKAGLDKLTFDMAQDFKPYKVAVAPAVGNRPPASTKTNEKIRVLPKTDCAA